MGKFTMQTKVGEAIQDERVIMLFDKYCPSVMEHPRFSEGLDFTFQEIIDMNLGIIAGVSKAKLKKMVKESLELE